MSATFTVADIKRAIKAVTAAGQSVAGVDFPKHGGFRILTGPPADLAPDPRLPNEWDDVLRP